MEKILEINKRACMAIRQLRVSSICTVDKGKTYLFQRLEIPTRCDYVFISRLSRKTTQFIIVYSDIYLQV